MVDKRKEEMTKMTKPNHAAFDLDALAEEEAFLEDLQSDRQTGRASYYKVVEGKNVFRVIPKPANAAKSTPWRIVSEHFINLPTGGSYVFACPREMDKAECPVCDEGFKLMRNDNDEDKQHGKELLPRLKFYMNVIDRKDEAAGPKIYAATSTVYKELKKILKDKDIGGDFTDPETGFDIVLHREGTKMTDTRYQVTPMRNASPLGNPDWVTEQRDLDFYARVPSKDEILSRLKGDSPRKSDVKGELTGKTLKKPSAKMSLDVDDDDDLFDSLD